MAVLSLLVVLRAVQRGLRAVLTVKFNLEVKFDPLSAGLPGAVGWDGWCPEGVRGGSPLRYFHVFFHSQDAFVAFAALVEPSGREEVHPQASGHAVVVAAFATAWGERQAHVDLRQG